LFPILSADELNTLEATLLVKVRFSIFIRQELFLSFLDKLLTERVSAEINAIVNNSDFARHHLFPNMRTLPSTPEPCMSLDFKTPVSFHDCSARKDQTVSSYILQTGTPRRLLAQTVAPVVIEGCRLRRGRSNSVSGRNSSSSFLDDDNSLEYSRTSSRRHSLGRNAQVPPPPIFEPIKYQGHPRRLSLGKAPRDIQVGDGVNSSYNTLASRISPRSRSFARIGSQRPLPLVQKWNGLF
jgi:hypothetical protein